jgi:GNAT superfamily N-acetyltransferase
MQVAQQIMRLTPMSVLVQPIFVAECDGQIAGFYALRSWQDEPAVERAIELDLFFVDVPFIGTGVGRVLFDHAVQVSTAMGYHTMVIISDPNAEGFYAKMGASTFARHQSEIVENRFLPVMQLALK